MFAHQQYALCALDYVTEVGTDYVVLTPRSRADVMDVVDIIMEGNYGSDS